MKSVANLREPNICLVFQASESKREQFRRYLEKSGVLDTITSGKYASSSQTLFTTYICIISTIHWLFTSIAASSPFRLSSAVLVALYEEADKPNNALEYPFNVYAV